MTQTTTYNSHEHLIKIKGKDGQVKDYLPANWRLHELRVTCPTATIESEIVFMDQEHNFVIVKATIYDGKSYEESSRRASSMKQGLLTSLDKVETGAKSRAARDFGISTELALDSEPEEDLDPAPAPPQQQNSTPLSTTPTGKPTLSVVPPEEKKAEQPTSGEGSSQPPTKQQLESIKNLANLLGQEYKEPRTFNEARVKMANLAREYNQAKAASAN